MTDEELAKATEKIAAVFYDCARIHREDIDNEEDWPGYEFEPDRIKEIYRGCAIRAMGYL